MIEWISSKVVMAIAVIVLIGVVIGFFNIQQQNYERIAFDNVCKDIARSIDFVSMTDANITTNLTFTEGKSGTLLPMTFRGKSYTIEIRSEQVIMMQDDWISTANLVKKIHPWNPHILNNGTNWTKTTQQNITLMNEKYRCVKVTSGTDIHIERVLLIVSGNPEYHTFIYVE